MGMGFAPTWLRQVSPPASQNHFNHCGCLTTIAEEQKILFNGNVSQLQFEILGKAFCDTRKSHNGVQIVYHLG